MHGRAQPKTHHPHRLSSRFHTPTPLNGLCLKEGKQNKIKKHFKKKKKRHSTPMLFALWFVVPTKQSDWAQQHLQNSLRLRLVPTLPKPPVVLMQCRGPEPPLAVPGLQSSAPSLPCQPQPLPSQVTSPAQGRFCAGQRTPGCKSKRLRGAGVNEVGKDPKSSFPPRAYGAARWATPCSFGFPDPSPPSQGEP